MNQIRIRALKLAFLLAWLATVPAFAQDDYALFQKEAGGASLLYRGRKAFVYNLVYNGTYYWSTPQFHNGTVRYLEKDYANVPLNVDAVRQELLVRLPSGLLEKIVDSQFTQEFSIAGSRFLNLRYLYGETAPEGYWEVLYDGESKFVRRVTKRLVTDLDNNKRELTGYDGPYRSNVSQTFIRDISYCYVKPDGTLVPVRRRRDLLKQFEPSFRREIRREIRHAEERSVLPFEQFCTVALHYVDSK